LRSHSHKQKEGEIENRGEVVRESGKERKNDKEGK
jgi:hypothetical protein